jgi:hypothetical protein
MLPLGCPVPRQEFDQPVDGMISDAGEHVGEPGLRIDGLFDRTRHQRPKRRTASADALAAIRARSPSTVAAASRKQNKCPHSGSRRNTSCAWRDRLAEAFPTGAVMSHVERKIQLHQARHAGGTRAQTLSSGPSRLALADGDPITEVGVALSLWGTIADARVTSA